MESHEVTVTHVRNRSTENMTGVNVITTSTMQKVLQ